MRTITTDNAVTDSGDKEWHVIYKSNNFLVRLVGKRFLYKVNALLQKIGAHQKRGVEIGCGEAHLLNFLLQEKTIDDSIVALDISLSDLEFARSRFPFFDYILGDAENAPLGSNNFDFVVILEVLEHVDDPVRVLAEIIRIAKPGSSILISVPHEPYFHLANLFRGKYIKRFGKTPNHKSFWTSSEFTRLLENYLNIEEKYYYSVFPWQLYLCRTKEKQTFMI